jgi:transcriptional regulator with XRE-family HTH domain
MLRLVLVSQLLDRLLEDVRDRVSSGEISAARLAAIAGVSQPHLCNIMLGRRELTVAVAERLQRALAVDSRELLGALDAGASGSVRRWFDAA